MKLLMTGVQLEFMSFVLGEYRKALWHEHEKFFTKKETKRVLRESIILCDEISDLINAKEGEGEIAF